PARGTGDRRIRTYVDARERPVGSGHGRPLAAGNDRLALIDRAGNLAVTRDENVWLAADDRLDVVPGESDSAVRSVENERNRARVVPHQVERLQPELRVLQRQGIQRADQAHVR